MAKQKPFQKFEALAQQLVEGSFNRFFGQGVTVSGIATELSRVVEDSAVEGWVPARYEIRLNPAEFDRLRQSEPEIMTQLTDYLRTFVQQSGLHVDSSLHLTLVAEPAVVGASLQVVPVVSKRPSAPTTTQLRQPDENLASFAAEVAALDAYLIVEGQRHVPLNKPVITLGRHIDNDVVLDAPTVSRQHAQIRWRYGRFILYDVSRRGRTQVNSQTVNETVLRSGDVISLSDVKLIYGEGETQQRPRQRSTNDLTDETQIRPPSSNLDS
ncbi:MAG: DUF3662 domain-containing protein [Ardenticatenaceae bacterium]|nr:DUF3662 domain-containing protein [Ardenticatenaceae bacterium]